MAFYSSLYCIFIFSILLVIPLVESIRCLNDCTFQDLQLNSSIPLNICAPLNQSNSHINENQTCLVLLSVDFTTGLINGSFHVKQHSNELQNRIYISTYFSLTDTSIKIDIDYTCFMSDYCDLDFAHETLSPAFAAMQLESFRQNLTHHLYNPNNSDPVNCVNNTLCPQNASLCMSTYLNAKFTTHSYEIVQNQCSKPNRPLEVQWRERYRFPSTYYEDNTGIYACNVPNCASNATAIKIFRWLKDEYILPINISGINSTTTPQPTTITTTISTTVTTRVTTTSNDVSSLIRHFNSLIPCFVIILSFYRSFF